MPKVRASSGTMGTMCLPIRLSLSKVVSIRTKAMVVELSLSPVPCSWVLKISSGGAVSDGALLWRTGK